MKRKGIEYLLRKIKSKGAICIDNRFFIYYQPSLHIIWVRLVIWGRKPFNTCVGDKLKELKPLLKMYEKGELEKDRVLYLGHGL